MIDRLVRVLASFDPDHQSLSTEEIATRAKLPSSTAYRLVGEMMRHDLLQRDHTGHLRIGVGMWELSNRASDAVDLASVARPHMMAVHEFVSENTQLGILREREVLAPVRGAAEIVVDTSGLNVHQLSRKTSPIFMSQSAERVRLAVLSFGFKYGVPLDADFVFDLRFLPNPHWVPELRPYTGRERQVSEYVLGQPGAREFIDGAGALMQPVIAGYLRENRRYATVAVGCTGGKHRSVAVAEALAAELRSEDVATFVVHRDLGQE